MFGLTFCLLDYIFYNFKNGKFVVITLVGNQQMLPVGVTFSLLLWRVMRR